MLLGTTFLKEEFFEDEKVAFLMKSDFLCQGRTAPIWSIDEHELIIN